ncbi:protein kinase, partial [Nocardia sp. NPDC101769]|uniref:serine/threonine-protein kinase n=1 Tax=Nocardia sp. NPDC101769 TaxID=3364333 RepID=UPI00381B4BC1
MDRVVLRPGEVFAGYTVEMVLGVGGMGTVYRARDPELPRSVALKLLHRDLTGDEYVRSHFELEAAHAARLEHPNIVPVHRRGRVGDQLWISMQFIDTTDAAAAVAKGPLDPARAVHIIGETAKALDYAHSLGVLHRDVKPANILLEHPRPGRPGRVLLADFGIAKALADTAHMTQTGTGALSLQYASPEQFDAQIELDDRTDVYSLGCTLFQLLTGRLPYPGTTLAHLYAGHVMAPIPKPCTVRPDLPAGFDAVIERALAKNRDHRYRSCGDLAAAALHAVSAPDRPIPAETVINPAVREPKPAPGPAAENTAIDTPSPTDSDAADTTTHDAAHTAGQGIGTSPSADQRVPRPPSIPLLSRPPSSTDATELGNPPAESLPDEPPAVAPSREPIASTDAETSAEPAPTMINPNAVHRTGTSDHTHGATAAEPRAGDLADQETIRVHRATGSRAKRRWWVLVAAVTAVAALIGIASWKLVGTDHTGKPNATTTYAVTATIPVGKGPVGVAVDPAGHSAYVTDNGANSVSVIDTITRTVTATIPVGNNPIGVAVDPAGHSAYVTDNGANSVSVIDTITRTV